MTPDSTWHGSPRRSSPSQRYAAACRGSRQHCAPGGWLIVGRGKSGGTPVQDALTRLKTIACGGTPLNEAAACRLLRDAGLTSVAGTLPSGRAGHHHRPETRITKTAATSTGTRSNTSALPNVTRPDSVPLNVEEPVD